MWKKKVHIRVNYQIKNLSNKSMKTSLTQNKTIQILQKKTS